MLKMQFSEVNRQTTNKDQENEIKDLRKRVQQLLDRNMVAKANDDRQSSVGVFVFTETVSRVARKKTGDCYVINIASKR